MSASGCHKSLAFGKQKYPCIKYVLSYCAPNIASSLKFSSLKNAWFKHSLIETLRIKKPFVRIFAMLKVTTILSTFSWQMKQIFNFLAMPILRTVTSGQLRIHLIIHQETLLSEKLIVWCGVAFFWVNWYTFLRKQGRWGSNSKFSLLPWDASRISETKSAEIWCWNPNSLVSARWGNSSHCVECNVSPQHNVSRSCDLRKRECWIAC